MSATETDARPRRAPAPAPTLRLLYAGDAGVVQRPPRALRRGALSLGREVAAEDGIGLPEDRRASRVHARVVLDGPGQAPRLVDAGSKNGTFHNGRRVDEAALADGDLIRVGGSLLLLRYEPPQKSDAPVPSLLGVSPAARALRGALHRVGPTGLTVLLSGESGAGKEVAARAVHELSGRPGAFVAVNCAAIPESLAESQLFGHVSGAFTGASAQPGLFRAAERGTLFLDELGELPAPLQPKLLRALEERAVVPVGATRPVPCDVRLVAATNRDLQAEVGRGAFRGDLLARLCEVPLRLPPLRERREDILLLLRHAFSGDGEEVALPPLSMALLEALLLHPYPYNVRELQKIAAQLRLHAEDGQPLELELVADRLAPLPANPADPMGAPRDAAAAAAPSRSPSPAAAPSRSPSPAAAPSPGPSPAAAPSPGPSPAAGASAEAEVRARGPIPTAEALRALLRQSQGNLSQVARAVGRSRTQVERWLDAYGIDLRSFRR